MAALVAVLLLTGCNGDDATAGKQAPEPEAVPVAVVPVRADPVQRTVDVVGTLFGQEDTYISNKIPGRITNIFVDVGDRVAPGQTLAQLLKNDYQLSLDEKVALLQESLASLGVSDVPDENFDLEAVPAVERARLEAQNAKAKLERGRKLHEAPQKRISDQEFADLETQSQVAQSAYEAALLEAGTAVRTARTRKAQVAIAEQVMRDTTIRAPRPFLPDGSGPLDPSPPPGPPSAATQPVADASDSAAVPAATDDAHKPYVVAARLSSEGELNSGLTRMFRLVIDDPLKMRANVPERHAGRIEVGQTVLVRVEAGDEPVAGRVARINPQIDPANRTFEVEVAVPNPRHVLKPGAFARAEIQTHVEPDVLLVPERAIVSFAGVKKVYTVKDGKAVEVPIATGAQLGEWIEVTKAKNLKAGEPVVVDGVNKMAGGVPVTVGEASAAAVEDQGPTTQRAADAGPAR